MSYQVIESVNCYCSEIERVKNSVSKKELLLGKLVYIAHLAFAYPAGNGYATANNCSDMDLNFRNASNGSLCNQKSLAQHHWSVRYEFELLRQTISTVRDVFFSFCKEELEQLYYPVNERWFSGNEAAAVKEAKKE